MNTHSLYYKYLAIQKCKQLIYLFSGQDRGACVGI